MVRDIHRREYRRTMRRIVAGSVVLWFVLAIVLANNDSSGAIVPMSIVMLIGLAITRVVTWKRYRLHMRAELAGSADPRDSAENAS